MKKISKKIIGIFIVIGLFLVRGNVLALSSSITPSIGAKIDYRNDIDLKKNLTSTEQTAVYSKNYLYNNSTPLFSTEIRKNFPTNFNSSCKILKNGSTASLSQSNGDTGTFNKHEWNDYDRSYTGTLISLINRDIKNHPADKNWYYYMGQYAINDGLRDGTTNNSDVFSSQAYACIDGHEDKYFKCNSFVKNGRAIQYIKSLINAAGKINNNYNQDFVVFSNYQDKNVKVPTYQDEISFDFRIASFANIVPDVRIDAKTTINGNNLTAEEELKNRIKIGDSANCWDSKNGQHLCNDGHYVKLTTDAPASVKFYYKTATANTYTEIQRGVKTKITAKLNYENTEQYKSDGELNSYDIPDSDLGDLKVKFTDGISKDFNINLEFIESRKIPYAYNYDCGKNVPTITPALIENTIKDFSTNVKLKIKKIDLDGRLSLRAYNKNGNVIDVKNGKIIDSLFYEIQYNNDKPIIFENTNDDYKIEKFGKYCLRQISAPDGYAINEQTNSPVCFTISYDNAKEKVVVKKQGDFELDVGQYSDGNYYILYKFVNDLNKVRIGLVDINDKNKKIGPAKLQIEDKNGNVVIHNNQKLVFDYNPNSSNKYEISGLPFGEYYLVEKNTPEGYIKNTEKLKFIINGKSTAENNKYVYLKNTPISLTVSKYDKTYHNRLAGAKLQILKADTNVIATTIDGKKMSWTSTIDPQTYIGVPTGDYILREIEAPKGYDLVDDISFTINENGEVLLNGVKKTELSIVNVPLKPILNTILFNKIDKETKRTVVGARLQILNSNKEVVTLNNKKLEWTVSEDNNPYAVEGLVEGTYYLHEVSVPEGYENSADIKFIVDEDGKVTYNGSTASSLTSESETRKSVVSFKKVNESGKTVSGVKLQILNSNKEVVTLNNKKLEWTTDSSNSYEVKGLGIGSYYLHEVSVPDGYEKSSDVEFTVNSIGKVLYNGNVVSEINTVIETKKVEPPVEESITADISFKKVNESGKTVSGVKLQILNNNKEVVTLNNKKLEWTTDSSNSYEVKGLGIGSYYLHEVSVPDGYEKSSDVKFTVNSLGKVLYNGNVVSEINAVIEEENHGQSIEDPVTATVSLKKINESGKTISGVKLQILNNNKEVVTLNNKKLEWTTSSDSYEVEGLEAGTYYLHEVSVPDGYEKSSDVKFTVNSLGKVLYNGNVVSEINAVIEEENHGQSIEDPVTATVSFKKINESGKTISGVKLQILNNNKEVVTLNNKKLEWTTSSDSYEVEGLGIGTYYLHEVSVPDGYEKSSDVKFTVNSLGKVLYNGSIVSEIKVIVKEENQKIDQSIDGETVISTNVTTKVYISKINEKTKEIVVGAHFELRDEKDVLIEEWDSTTEAHYIEKLSVGHTYRVIQTKAGIDDSISDPIVFTVDKDGNITGDTVFLSKSVSVPNTLLRKSLYVLVIGILLVISGMFIVNKKNLIKKKRS